MFPITLLFLPNKIMRPMKEPNLPMDSSGMIRTKSKKPAINGVADL
jgi:hypothetical protein